MLYRKIWIVVLCFLCACSSHKYKNPHVQIQTKFGNIEVELYPQQAPKTVAAFLSYVDSGFFNNSSFYRILNLDNQPSNAPKSELIQGGIWKSNYKLAARLPGIPLETTQQTKILHTDGTISLARQDLNSGNTEFFICIGNQHGFDYGGANNPDGQGYAAFGKVVDGMDIVIKIYHAPEDDQSFTPPVPIYNIIML